MNEHLRIEEPAGAEWTFSLDPNRPRANFQPGRTFTMDANGLPFVDGVGYAVYAHHTPTDSLFSELVVFRAGPESCLLVPDLDLPDLEAIMRRGNISSRIAIVAGVKVRVFPTVTSADYLLCERSGADGLKEIVRIALADLKIGEGTATPDLAVIAHYEPVPVDTTPDLEIIAHYEPAPLVVGAVPGKPINVQLTKVGTATDAALTWRLADQTETGVELRLLNADGAWGAPFALAARVQSYNVPAIGYGMTKTYQVRAVNAAGQGPWSDSATIRFQTFIYDFYLFGTGQPPVRLGVLSNDSQQTLPQGNINLGVTVRDRNVNVPSLLDYDRMSLFVTLPSGRTVGWDADVQAGPSIDPRYLFPRPDGIAPEVGLHTITATLYLGENNQVGTASVSVYLLAAPTKPLPASALRASRKDGVVTLNWAVNATNANYQRIMFRAGSGGWEKLVELLPGDTTFSTADIKVNGTGVTYSFQVITGNTQGESVPSNTATLSPDTVPNRPPIMPTFPNQAATVGTAFSYQLPVIGDPDGDAVTVVLTGLTSGLSYTASTRTVAGAPTASGAVIVTVTATDVVGASSVGSLRIDVVAQANRAPVAPTLPDLVNYRGSTLSIVLPPFTDPDGDALTYSLPSNAPPGLTFNAATRGITGTPLGAGSGGADVVYSMQYAATDSRGASTLAAFRWIIRAPQNQPPVAPNLPTQTYQRNSSVSYPVPAFVDPEGQAVTLSVQGLPTGLQLGVGNKVVGVPSTAGQFVATFTASDGQGGVTNANQTYVIEAPKPVITQVRKRIVSHDATNNRVEIEASTSLAFAAIQWSILVPGSSDTFAGYINWDQTYGPQVLWFTFPKADPQKSSAVQIRPTDNLTAVAGPYPFTISPAPHDWQLINQS